MHRSKGRSLGDVLQNELRALFIKLEAHSGTPDINSLPVHQGHVNGQMERLLSVFQQLPEAHSVASSQRVIICCHRHPGITDPIEPAILERPQRPPGNFLETGKELIGIGIPF